MPDLGQGLKWQVQFCLRVPPSAAQIVPIGSPAIHTVRLKILFFVSISFTFLFIIILSVKTAMQSFLGLNTTVNFQSQFSYTCLISINE